MPHGQTSSWLGECVRWAIPLLGRAFDVDIRHDDRSVVAAEFQRDAGAKVLVFLGAANRDPRKWGGNADEFDLDRNASGHVAFGMGLHQCVGQPIARLEMEIVLQQLLQRMATIEPDGAPVPILHNVLRGFESLPVRVTAT